MNPSEPGPGARTRELLDALRRAPDAQLSAWSAALYELVDERTVPDLYAIVDDPSTRADVRIAAAELLFGELVEPGEAWCEGAFREGGLRAALAATYAHPGWSEAVLTWLQALPEVECPLPSRDRDSVRAAGFADVRARWIVHPDPARRAWAVEEAYWNEPVDLVPALIERLHDADPAIAGAAAEALVYQPGLAAWRALRDLRRTDAAASAIEAARDEMDADLARALRWTPRLAGWLGPDAEGLPPPPDDPPVPATPTPRTTLDLAALERWIDAEDGPPARGWTMPFLWALPAAQAATFAPVDRDRWLTRLAGHRDPVVRQIGARWFEAFDDGDGLAALAVDPDAGVRKVAVWSLGRVSARPALAEVAWGVIARPDTWNTAMSEAVATWSHHAAEGAERSARWRELRGHASVSARCAALRALGAAGDLADVAPCWAPGPGESVAEVCAWLDAVRSAKLPAHVPQATATLDSLWVQDALGRLREILESTR